MCVIIAKNPGIELPFEKLESACHVNSDGWGVSFIDRGKMEIHKEFDPKGNDPDKVAKFLEQCKDMPTFIHLRFTTKGAKDVDNCHPFVSLDQAKYGYGVGFMHNGTVYDGIDSKSDRSDSHQVNEFLIAPTVEAFFHTKGEDVLEDPTFKRIISKFCNTSSCFLLYDTNGKWMVIDEKKGGKQFDGWWASNEYSFNRTHRDKSSGNGSTHWSSQWDDDDGRYYNGYPYGGSWSRGSQGASSTSSSASSGTGVSVLSKDDTAKEEPPFLAPAKEPDQDLKEQCTLVGTAISAAKRKGLPKAELTPPSKRVTFIELADLNSLSEVTVLTEEELEDLVVEQPGAATLLLMDLIHALYTENKRSAH